MNFLYFTFKNNIETQECIKIKSILRVYFTIVLQFYSNYISIILKAINIIIGKLSIAIYVAAYSFIFNLIASFFFFYFFF